MEKKKPDIRLIALDLDRTTLNSNSELAPRTKAALEAAIKQGVNVVIATGRPFVALPKNVTEIEGIQYALTSNGAQMYTLADEKAIFTNCISKEAIFQAETLMRNMKYKDVTCELFIEGRAYVEEEIFRMVESGGKTYRDRDYVLTTRTPVRGLLDMMHREAHHIENINFFYQEESTRSALEKELVALSNVTLTSSMPNNWEIGGENTSKASALCKLCEILELSTDSILACGDSPNDSDMIRLAGIGVAMANAEEEVKEIADFVTLSNDEDGVAVAVEKFVLQD